MSGVRLVWGLSDAILGNAVRLLFRLAVRDRDRVPPEGPFVLVANHASYLDPLLLGAALRAPCRFLARSSLERIPVVGAWMRAIGVVFVHRGAARKEPLERAAELLARGERVALFPEGTRTRTGRMGPFRRGLLLLLKKTGARVVPVGIRGSFQAYPPGRRLPRLFRRCEVRFGAPVPAAEVLAVGGLEKLQRRVARLAGQDSAMTVDGDTSATGRREDAPGEAPPARARAASPSPRSLPDSGA